MREIAFLPYRKTIYRSETPMVQEYEKYYKKYKNLGLSSSSITEKYATQARVIPTYKNVWLSLDKCDLPSVVPHDDIQDVALDYTMRMLQPALRQYPLWPNQSPLINSGSSPGTFWKDLGLNSKIEAVNSPLMERMFQSVDHPP